MANLTILNFNVKGVSSFEKRCKIFTEIILQNPDIAILTETHAIPDDLAQYKAHWQQLGGFESFWAPSDSRSKGVAILFWKSQNNFVINTSEILIAHRVLSVQIIIDKQSFNVVALYAPNSPIERRTFFQNLGEINFNNKIFLIGDFNCVEFPKLDRKGPGINNSPLIESCHNLNSFNAIHGLHDSFRHNNPLERIFTFASNIPGIESRIDRAYMPIDITKTYKTIFLPSKNSDHKIVITKFLIKNVKNFHRGPSYWKFNPALLKNNEFIDKIRAFIHEFYQNWDESKNIEYWEILKGRLKMISIDFDTNLRNKNKNAISIAEQTILLEKNKLHPDQDVIDVLNNEINDIRSQEIDFLILQNKLDKIEFDEKSSPFFFSRLKNRAEKSNILSLKNSEGISINKPHEILSEIHQFYTQLYSEQNVDPESQNLLVDKLTKTISQESADALEEDLTLRDFTIALKHMENGKSPGADGLPAEFYKTFQNQLLPILVNVAKEAQNAGKLPPSQRQAILTLTYKNKGDKNSLENWRPISLMCTDYKIISKALANKIQAVLPEIIHTNQVCGIPGRTIFDNLSLVRDLIDHATQNNLPSLILSLDMHKAFDRVNHDLITKVMDKFGFENKIITWFLTLYNGGEAFAQNNGFFTKKINISQGIRQGCALSLILYVIVAEIFAQAIRSEKQILGYKLPWTVDSVVKIAQYADDINIFIPIQNHRKTTISFTKLFEILKIYEKASGASLNFQKSNAAIVGGALSPPSPTNFDLTRTFRDNFPDFPIPVGPIDLGLIILKIQFFANQATTYSKNFRRLLENVKNFIKFLRSRRLSIKGRALAINSLILSKIWYVATVIPATRFNGEKLHEYQENFIKIIEHEILEYLWNHGNPFPLSRDIIYAPIAKGGLGVLNIEKQCIALRFKNLIKAIIPGYITPDPLPSIRFARHWLANDIANNYKPFTVFLNNYMLENDPPVPNKVYKILVDTARSPEILNIFEDIEKPPTTQKIYKQILLIPVIFPGVKRWHHERFFPNPDFSNSWETLLSNHLNEKFWRTRHFILNRVDHINSMRANVNNPTGENCAYCKNFLNRPTPSKDTHVHCLFHCPRIFQAWGGIFPILIKIGIRIPPISPHIILGFKGHNLNVILANTLVAATINAAWNARNNSKFENEHIPSKTISKIALNMFKNAIRTQFQLAHRKNDVVNFAKKFNYPQILQIRGQTISFLV